MTWFARSLLFIPAIVAGWFVSREDPRFWVVAMVVALVFLALLCVAAIYAPTGSIFSRRRGRRRRTGRRSS
ncbi:hypothetical protein [Sphingobium sp.]|uniref:hypothetical protein n=1 Tax=Sphingobium sp. TaxID=1912891 RepID=UPI000DB27289|nr:hypothetical protein [Sphingobium sp.]PZU64025.1 MAG: hypothetical protein DI540_21820 [Sphingobium sp.]